MIVFTATNIQTSDVYVATARDSVEEEWADLLSQADNGVSGKFFQQLRDQGAAGFEVDTWAYGESASEARESMREARAELGAQPVKSSRGKSVVRASTPDKQNETMKALMSAIAEAMTDDGVSVDDALDDESPAMGSHDSQEVVEPQSSMSDRTEVSGSTPAQPQSDDEKFMARLEAMKAAQAKLLNERQSKANTERATRAPQAKIKAAKVANGRASSAAKEKRIREAIEVERERRDNIRQINSRDEHAEMNSVMARIEMRRQATKKANADKAKARAAQTRKAQKAEADAVAGRLTKSQPSSAAKPAVKSTVKPAAVKSPAKPKAVKAPAAAPTKLAAGRTGSSAKEKRIKEAIELEKSERMAQKQAQTAAEAAEMAAILTRLDERVKSAEKIKRRR